ncbi:MAG: hypothetical protein HYX97_05850 [Chloroflexi bacterium]|nr:hypothetical protein [Chloroflexota bacterium]
MSATREPDAPPSAMPTDSPVTPETPAEPVVSSQDAQRLETVQIELRTAQAQLAERDQTVTALREQLARAVASYRAAALAVAPDLPADVVRGDTIEEVEASLGVAREVVAQVRRQVQAQALGERVPGGAPARGASPITHLTPAQKIAQGLTR